MNYPARIMMSEPQYLAWEERQERKHELVDGEVRAMAGASVNHNRVARNLCNALQSRLADSPCEAFNLDLKVHTRAKTYRYPDVVVDCGAPSGDDLAADRPTLVAEVLSPSTEWFDATAKLEEYKALDTMRHIILLSQRRIYAQVFTRTETGWAMTPHEGPDASLALPALGLEVPLAEAYARVVFAAAEEA